MASLPLIPSAVVGSHGKPGWWFATVKAYEAGEYGPGDLDEMFDDAADTAIRDMERAGLDVITDGEVRRLDGYVDSYYAIIKGIQPLPVRRKAGPWGYDQQTRYEATGRIETPEGGLGIVKEFEYLKAHTDRGNQGHLRGPAHLRLAHSSGQDVQGRGRRGRALRRGDQRGAQGPGRGGRRLHPARRAGPRQCLGRGDGAPLQPGHGRREGQARLSHLLRQPLRPLALRPRRTGRTSPASSRRARISSCSSSRAASCPSWTSGRSTGSDRELGAGVVDVKGFYPEKSRKTWRKRIRRVLAGLHGRRSST